MNTHSKAKLQELAIPHFARLNVKTLHATSDGQFFLLQNRALLHANGKMAVYELQLEGDGSNGDEMPTIQELKLMVATVTELNDLKMMLHAEVAGDNRTEAVDVIMAKLEELTEDTAPAVIPSTAGSSPEGNTHPAPEGADPSAPLTVGEITQAIANTPVTTEDNPTQPAPTTPAAASTQKTAPAKPAGAARKTAKKK